MRNISNSLNMNPFTASYANTSAEGDPTGSKTPATPRKPRRDPTGSKAAAKQAPEASGATESGRGAIGKDPTTQKQPDVGGDPTGSKPQGKGVYIKELGASLRLW